MLTRFNVGKGLTALSVGLVLAACSPTITQHGHRLSEDDLSQIQPGLSSKRDVLSILGSPSAQGTFEDDHWYYVAQRTERTSFYQKELTQQDVLTVTFDSDGKVTSIGKHGIEAANAVLPSPEKTKTLGNELTLVEQLLGNIGRFNSGDDGP